VAKGAGINGLHVCTAMNSGGVTYSAAAGHLVADFLAETDPRFDAGAFLPERFGENARDLAWLQREISTVVSRGYRQSL
jgi:glycine/D-amino acid oxidase-like deaminating enzyme